MHMEMQSGLHLYIYIHCKGLGVELKNDLMGKLSTM